MEYTVAAATAAALIVAVDHALGVRVTRRRSYWVFIGVMTVFMLIVNGYLTWRPIVLYGADHILGLRVVTIPVEDFVYGFGLITLTISLWEHRRGRSRRASSRRPADVPHATER